MHSMTSIYILDVMPARCRGLVACLCCRGFMEKINKKLYGEKLLQSTMFSKKKLQN